MVVLHQSSAKVAADCLARFKAEYVDGVKTDSPYATLGTLVHAGIEAAYRGEVNGVPQVDAALDAMTHAWHAIEAQPAAWVRSEAEMMLRAAYAPSSALYLKKPRAAKMAVEQAWAMDADFNAVRPDSLDAAYAGRMDAIQWGTKDGIRVLDWKTIRAMPSAAELEDDVQARVYALAALSLFPEADKVTFSLVLIRHQYEASVTFKRGEPWEERTKAWLEAVRGAIMRAEATETWPEQPGDACGWCPVRHRCESLAALVSQGALPDDATPEDVARTYLAAKSLAAEAEKRARELAGDAPIPVGIGKVLGFKPGSRKEWTFGLADILAQLETDGAEESDLRRWFPGASVTVGALEVAATELLQRGEIEGAPHEYVDGFRESRPSVTFTTWMEVGRE